MTQDNFKNVISEQIQRSVDLLISKGQEYDGNHGDRLLSFKVAGALAGKGQIQALAGMMAKHTVSVYDMCARPIEHNVQKWDEKITDHINYLLILRAMIAEEMEGNTQ